MADALVADLIRHVWPEAQRADDPDAWLAELDDVRRPHLEELDARSRSGRSGDWMCRALASNKQYVSLYAGPIELEPLVSRLPKANLGRGWIRFRRLADVDLAVIDEVVRASAATDGQAITY